MIKGSVEELEECTKKKETIALKLKILDESRLLLLKRLSGLLEIDENDLNLSLLGELLGEEYKQRFTHISHTLRKKIEEITVINRSNRSWLELYMNHIRVSLSYINQTNFQQCTYISTGETKGPNFSGRTLYKA